MTAGDPCSRLHGGLLRASVLTGAIGALVLAMPAAAVAPTLSSVSQQARHPTATFSAPKADSATIYLASKPDQATDGSFLRENIKALDLLTDSEIQAGRWVSEDQVDPGTYHVMMRASPDFAQCYVDGGYDPACADGYSNIVTLQVPKPATRYTASVTPFRFIGRATHEIRASPLGEDRAYRACYRLKTRKTRCLRRTINGFSWNSSASDTLTVNTRPLPTLATFTWYVDGRAVAVKRTRVR
jgi:hypothetical protein